MSMNPLKGFYVRYFRRKQFNIIMIIRKNYCALLCFFFLLSLVLTEGCTGKKEQVYDDLASSFDNPPDSVRPSCFWWWFNSLVDREGITRDLEEFRAKGMGAVTIVCTGNDYGVAEMPRGPVFLSPEWMDLYRYALKEAGRLGLTVGVNFGGGGWTMGGPWMTPEMNPRWFVQSEMSATGPVAWSGKLPVPDPRGGYDPPHFGNVTHYMTWPKVKMDYRISSLVAFREEDPSASSLGEERMKLLAAKSNRKDAPIWISPQEVTGPTLEKWQTFQGDQPVLPAGVIDLTSFTDSLGNLSWEVPEGKWTIITTGHVATGADVRCVLPELGYVLEADWLSSRAMKYHFSVLGDTLINAAGDLAGKTLKYIHSDSFEDGFPNWTGGLIESFRKYRGYDPTPYLPVFAGRIVGSAEISDRFLYDYRKTVADCFADSSYGTVTSLAHERGLLSQHEAAGPSWSGTVCFDALKNLGRCDYPMGEFWMDDGLTRNGQNYVGKQTASAAHIYGKRTVSAEAFTGGDHWRQVPSNLKPAADRAFCEGINRFVFHTMTSQRPKDGKPGYEYGAGTHFNPNVTWWDQAAGPWLSYVSRCQSLLQSGLFVADVLYYNGDWAPNLVREKHTDPSLGKGYDYDVCNAEVLLERLSVKDGLISLPDGMSYRLLVLPESDAMPVEVITKIRGLVMAGATVIGQKPGRDPGLRNYPQCDADVREIAASLWGQGDGVDVDRKVGKGRIITGKTPAEVLKEAGIMPDFLIAGSDSSFIDFIHRTTPDGELYFLANRHNRSEKVQATFRVAGRRPELWDPVTGIRRDLPEFRQDDGRTSLDLEFVPYGSMFVVFPKEPSPGLKKSAGNFPSLKPVMDIKGEWQVQFDRQWFYPTGGLTGEESEGWFIFGTLDDWSSRQEDAIRHFSGSAVYTIKFTTGENIAGRQVFLSLGKVFEIAGVKLNGTDAGVAWCEPWMVDVSESIKTGENLLEIEVVNLWPNRLIGDENLSAGERRTKTNVISFRKDDPLLRSGLAGPVQLVVN
jgi:hypothetical protein